MNILLFQREDRLYTYKDGPRAERVRRSVSLLCPQLINEKGLVYLSWYVFV